MPGMKAKPKNLVWVVGDIHGCYQEFCRLEDRIQRRTRKLGLEPYILSVGDLVDRGPGSCQVIDHFMKGTRRGTHFAVAGNHEAMMLECLLAYAPWNFEDGKIKLPFWANTVEQAVERGRGFARFATRSEMKVMVKLRWIAQGGAETLESYDGNPRKTKTWEIRREHMRYLSSLPLYWENDDAIVTHALAPPEAITALRKSKSSRKGFDEDWVHAALWSRKRPGSPPGGNKTHISGHSIVKRVRHDKKRNVIQVDTGCAAKGRLTALCLGGGETLSVKPG